MKELAKSNVILMAEDDSDDRLLVQDAIAESRWQGTLRFVENGEELLDYLMRRGRFKKPEDSPRPGLILLDLNMPKKDGKEALREIKADPKLRSIRIVIMTTSQTEEDIQRTYDLSATSYITKPVTFTGLVAVIKTLGKYWLE